MWNNSNYYLVTVPWLKIICWDWKQEGTLLGISKPINMCHHDRFMELLLLMHVEMLHFITSSKYGCTTQQPLSVHNLQVPVSFNVMIRKRLFARIWFCLATDYPRSSRLRDETWWKAVESATNKQTPAAAWFYKPWLPCRVSNYAIAEMINNAVLSSLGKWSISCPSNC